MSNKNKDNEPIWRKKVGGLWEILGKLQFDLLVKNGLQPDHYLLDVGCGSLRGGIHFVRFLEEGHYFGIDKDKDILEGGQVELTKNLLLEKKPILREMSNFEFELLEQKFDFALAQSVFSHLPLNDITRCLMSIEKVLVKNGKFLATFFENKQGKFNLESIHHPTLDNSNIISFFDKDPFHYDFQTFEWICQDTTLTPHYLGEWNHPRDQKLILFTKN